MPQEWIARRWPQGNQDIAAPAERFEVLAPSMWLLRLEALGLLGDRTSH